MKSKAERQAEFERREEIRKATYAAKKAAHREKQAALDTTAAEQKEAREAARDARDLQQLEVSKAMKARAVESPGEDVGLILLADWNRARKAKKRLRRRGLL